MWYSHNLTNILGNVRENKTSIYDDLSHFSRAQQIQIYIMCRCIKYSLIGTATKRLNKSVAKTLKVENMEIWLLLICLGEKQMWAAKGLYDFY